MRRSIPAYLAMLAVAALLGCSEDDPVEPGPDGLAVFEDLTERGDVLINLQHAYNSRNINEYQRLLDDNFVFFFSDGDVSGGTVPESWGYDDDVKATRNMFNRNYGGPNPITRITLALDLNNVQWEPVASDDPAYPGETWYQAVTTYAFTIQAKPDITFVVLGDPAVQCVVREFDDNGVTQWRLIRWHDLHKGGCGSYITSTALCESATWGNVKASYR